jgi:hypothetical protein
MFLELASQAQDFSVRGRQSLLEIGDALSVSRAFTAQRRGQCVDEGAIAGSRLVPCWA